MSLRDKLVGIFGSQRFLPALVNTLGLGNGDALALSLADQFSLELCERPSMVSMSRAVGSAPPEKVRRAEALRRSMLALMARTDKWYFAHPALWAPFVVVGEGNAEWAVRH